MPFPLLRLPLLPLEAVVKTMGMDELLTLSLCSKRMHLAVKNFRDKSIKFDLSVLVNDGIDIHLSKDLKMARYHGPSGFLSITIEEMRDAYPRGAKTDKFGGALFQVFTLRWGSYWKDVERGTKYLLEYLSDIFCAPISYVSINNNRFFWILDIVENLQGRGSYQLFMNDTNHRLTDEQFRHLLVDLNPSKLRLKSQPSAEFRIDNFGKSYHEFLMLEGNWLTIENLLTLDCVILQSPVTLDNISRKPFTVAEMNRFLRHVLIDGGAPRLIDFCVPLENDHENQRILDGIRDVLTPPSGRPQFEHHGDTWKFCGILKRDGRGEYVRIECSNNDISLRRIGNGLKTNA